MRLIRLGAQLGANVGQIASLFRSKNVSVLVVVANVQATNYRNYLHVEQLCRQGDLLYHASMQGRLRCWRGAGVGIDRRPAMIQFRVSAGSMTSSISSTDAIDVALPLA